MTVTATTTDFGLTAEEARPNGHGHEERDEHGKGRKPYKNRLEIWKPKTEYLEGYFDVKVTDPEGVEPNTIIKSKHDWKMHFSIYLIGDLWKCVCGTMCYEVYFERANDGQRYTLSNLVGHDLRKDFDGCQYFDDGRVHLDYWVDIPAGTLPPGDRKPAVYDWRAVVTLENPCGEMGVITGHDKGHVQVYTH